MSRPNETSAKCKSWETDEGHTWSDKHSNVLYTSFDIFKYETSSKLSKTLGNGQRFYRQFLGEVGLSG